MPAPIFILAPLPRSGTNFLWEIVRRHPCCSTARAPIWEDYVLKSARPLIRFAIDAQASWDPSWGSTDQLSPMLLKELGNGVVRFLAEDPHKRLVTKSPTIANLDHFFEIFPDAYLLLMVRDGRDVAASGMETFGWTLEEAATSWAWGVDRVRRFVGENAGQKVQLVTFEDLVLDAVAALPDLLRFLDLPAGMYDPAWIDEIPVRGSSSYRGGRSGVHWDPLPRPPSFRPVGRWRSWDAQALARYDAIAGEQLRALGYAAASVA